MSKEHGRMRLVLILGLVLGCGSTPNPKSCVDHHCSDPDIPFCDVDGSIGGKPNTCIAVDCEPNAFEECRDQAALTCNDSGDNYELLECEYGCGSSGCIACESPECEKRIVPKYVPTECGPDLATETLLVSEDTMIDTSDTASCTRIVTQPSGLDICVIKRRSIVIDTNRTLTVRGTRALALVADYSLDIYGTLDISANGTVSGPGGGHTKSGNTSSDAGGGGAGYRTAGAAGGSSAGTGTAPNAGAAGSSPVLVASLNAGSRAAQPAGTRTPGGAGGAATLVSCRNRVNITGVVDAGGGGGLPTTDQVGNGATTSTGGGSGGTIVIQAMQVEVAGGLFANGGAGGAGGTLIGGGILEAGQDGQRSTMPARGGRGSTANGGDGGTNFAPGPGEAVGTSRFGAGGASAGFIVVYTPENVEPTLTPSSVSPDIDPRQAIPTN